MDNEDDEPVWDALTMQIKEALLCNDLYTFIVLGRRLRTPQMSGKHSTTAQQTPHNAKHIFL